MQFVHWNAVLESVNNTNFDVLGVPTNQFGLQEPGSDTEIPLQHQYVRPGNGFIPNYKLSAKTECNGLTQEPIFTFLKGACANPQENIASTSGIYWTPVRQSDITWNFEKFLINAEGKPVRRYNPATSPFDMQDDIQELLAPFKSEKKDEENQENDVRKQRILQGLAQKHQSRP